MLEIAFGIIDILLVGGYVLWDYLKVYSDKETAFQWFIVFQFTLFFVYLLARSQVERSAAKRSTNAVIETVANVQKHITHNTKTLSQENFYVDFRIEINTAANSVDIAHLDTHPPIADPQNTTRKRTP